MKWIYLTAAMLVVLLSNPTLAEDAKKSQKQAGAWNISYTRSLNLVTAGTKGDLTLSENGSKAPISLTLGCSNGKIGNLAILLTSDLKIQKIVSTVVDGKEVTGRWQASTKNGYSYFRWPRDAAAAFLRSLPSAGKLMARLELDKGNGDGSFDIGA